MKRKNRFLSILLTLCMLVSLAPAAALPADAKSGAASVTEGEMVNYYSTLESALDNWTAGTILTLLQNVTVSETIAAPTDTYYKEKADSGTLTDQDELMPTGLNLNGCKMTAGDSLSTLLKVGEYAYLIVIDGDGNAAGGSLTGCKAKTVVQTTEDMAGCVYVAQNGVFELRGGTIGGNTAITGTVTVEGKFTMTGGSISGNRAVIGGGVYVAGSADVNNGRFAMLGGEIRENDAYGFPGSGGGGGVYVDADGLFTLRDDTEKKTAPVITGNRANLGGGVFVVPNGNMVMGGSVTVSGNKAIRVEGSEISVTGDDNLCVAQEDIEGATYSGWCYIFRALDENACIGATMVKKATDGQGAVCYDRVTGTFVFSLGEGYYEATTEDAKRFFSDSGDYETCWGSYFKGVSLETPWRALGEKLYNGSTDPDNPTRLVLERDYTAGEKDYSLMVAAGTYVELDLNGHVVNFNGGGRSLDVNGTLTLKDNGTTPRYGYWTENGYVLTTDLESAAVAVDLCDVYKTGGVLTGALDEAYCGAVMVGGATDSGTLNMKGGAICGNIGFVGGGVLVYNGAFNMSGDAIVCANYALSAGGGVYVDCAGLNGKQEDCFGTFSMSGGLVVSNWAEEYGGGVLVAADAGYLPGVFNVSGDVIVYGNVDGKGNDSNVVLLQSVNEDGVRSSRSVLNVAGELGEVAKLGVTQLLEKYTNQASNISTVVPLVGVFTNGLSGKGEARDFIPDLEGFEIRIVDGEAMLFGPSLMNGKVTAHAGALLIVAQYTDGKLDKVQTVKLSAECVNKTLEELGVAVQTGDYKLMLVNADNFAPLCAAWSK
ncbi:MAG: hypothetical protein J5449_01540 [Oscillospiraceae bacterium]|nr:hypothetical protein [Oscillospiraceae bacterium]